jgi:hypothetical protein
MQNSTPSTGVTPSDTSNLLENICFITEGYRWAQEDDADRDQANARFFDALVAFQGRLSRSDKSTITRQGIRLWQKGSVPARHAAFLFLREYLIWSKGKPSAAEWSEERNAAFERVDSYLRGAISLGGVEDVFRPDDKLPTLDPIIASAFQGLTKISQSSTQSEENSFFRGTRTEEQDQSYYLLYRHSTNYGDIIKSFLVIQKPIKGVRNSYVYNSFLRGGVSQGHLSHIFRECEGFIIKLVKSFYFLGYNYTIPADRRREPEAYKKQRVTAKWSPNGIGMLAFEYDDIHASPGLFPGLTMTVAAMSQPIVGRVAMLHLGTKQSFGRAVDDNLVMPDELKAGDVENDLVATIKRLKEAGCRRFGGVLDSFVAQADWEQHAAPLLSNRIVTMIDNTPAWEQSNRQGHRRYARGALEIYGNSRPRD